MTRSPQCLLNLLYYAICRRYSKACTPPKTTIRALQHLIWNLFKRRSKNIYEGEEHIHLHERQLHSTVDGDLPGSVFDSKQQTAPAVIDRLLAHVFPSALWFWRFGKSATKRGPPISSEPNIVRVAPAPMLLAPWNAGMLRITGFPKIRPGPL